MKTSILALFLIATPILGLAAQDVIQPSSDSSVNGVNVVREFAHNASADDWVLGIGWSWADGVLTHQAAGGEEPAAQVSVPALTPGRTYRVNVTYSGRTQGSVAIALGDASGPTAGQDGGYQYSLTPSSPDGPLTITPTADFDGSLSNIGVVELGDELVDETGWTVTEGWAQEGSHFVRTSDAVLGLERVVNVVRGHTYRVYFGLTSMSNAEPGPVRIWMSLAGSGMAPLNLNGNYEFDAVAAEDNGRLVFTPDAPDAFRIFDGLLRQISVREIMSDPVPSSEEAPPGSQ